MTHASRRRPAVHEPPHPVPRYAAVVIRDFLRISNKAQRAPTVRPGFVDVSRECAQTSLALIAKNASFSAESVEGGGLKNRYTFEEKGGSGKS
jgi:hypothetical protein